MAWGSLLLAEARPVLRLASGSAGTPASVTAVRALGLRGLAQGIATMAFPTRRVLFVGAGVDALHALSMIALGLASPRYRRASLLSAATASAALVAEVMLARDAGGHGGEPAPRADVH